MSFNKIARPDVPSFNDIVSQVHQIQSQKLVNEQARMANYEMAQTQQGKIGAANSGYGFQTARNNAGVEIQPHLTEQQISQLMLQADQAKAQQGLLPEQTRLAAANLNAQQQVLPHETRSQIAGANKKTAQDNLTAQNPLIGMPGNTGTLGVIQYLRNQAAQNPGAPSMMQNAMNSGQNVQQQPARPPNAGTPSLNNPAAMADFIERGMFAQQEKDMALSSYYNKRNDFLDFKSLPANTQNEMIATARGYGYKPDEALNLYKQGYKIEDLKRMAEENGADTQGMPVYSPTSSNVTQTKKAEAAVQEIDVISKHVTDAIAPYASRFNGYSLKQIVQAASGESPDAQARLFAAKALMPELSSARINAVGGNVGIEAIKDVRENSYGELKTLQPLVSEEVFRKSQEYLDAWIQEGQFARSESIYNVPKGVAKGAMESVSGASDPLGLFK